jgi:hypothetical protein
MISCSDDDPAPVATHGEIWLKRATFGQQRKILAQMVGEYQQKKNFNLLQMQAVNGKL